MDWKPVEVVRVVHGLQDPKRENVQCTALERKTSTINLHLLTLRREVGINVALELLEQQGRALCTATLVTDRVLNLNFVEDGAVLELDKKRIADRALARLVVLDAESLVLNAGDLGPQLVDARVLSSLVGVRLGGEVAVDERVGDHVVDVVAT